MKSITIALAALAIGAGSLTISTTYAGDDDLYWQLNRIEQAIEWQTFEEGIRYRQWQNDQWQAEQDYKRAQEQYERDHSLDWLDHYINQ